MRARRALCLARVKPHRFPSEGGERNAVKRTVIGMVLMASLYTVQSFAAGNGDRYVGAPFATRAPTIAQHGMAATMQPLASQIAISVPQNSHPPAHRA